MMLLSLAFVIIVSESIGGVEAPVQPPAATQPADIARQSSNTADRPQPLVLLEQYRQSRLSRSSFDWRREAYKRDEQNPGSSLAFTSRYANGDATSVCRGDKDGVVCSDPYGQPITRTDHHLLLRDGAEWRTDDGQLAYFRPAEWVKSNSRRSSRGAIRDVRAIDLMAYPGESVSDAIWRSRLLGKGDVPISYREESGGGLTRITARAEVGSTTRTICYTLDPSKAWFPTRVEYRRDGRVIHRMLSRPRQYDGVWFAETVVSLEYNKKGELAQRLVYTFDKVTTNGDLPASFKPLDIGIETGCNISVPSEHEDSGWQLQMWNGGKAVSIKEFSERLAAGDLKHGPTISRKMFGPRKSPPTRRETPVERLFKGYRASHHENWRRFSSDFIRRHELTQEQTHSAWGILADCEKRADDYLFAHRAELTQLATQISGQSDSKDARKLDSARREHEAERVALGQPLGEIFENQLKPRLAALLTAEQNQRDAGAPDQRATSHDNANDERVESENRTP
jgi:hypothetical protein